MNCNEYDPSTLSSSYVACPSVLTTLIPRPTAWISVYPPSSSLTHCTLPINNSEHDTSTPSASTTDSSSNSNNTPIVALVEGYCGASDKPPTLMLGSDSIPYLVLEGLRLNGVCALSVATEREFGVGCDSNVNGGALQQITSRDGEMHGLAKTFEEAGLEECVAPSLLDDLYIPTNTNKCNHRNNCNYFRRPPAVKSSPVHMHCRLIADVPLLDNNTNSNGNHTDNNPAMLLLQIDTYTIHGSILHKQTTLHPNERPYLQGNPDVRRITAKIDCLLLKPVASLGNGRFGRVNEIHHMSRPRPLSVEEGRMLSRSQLLINEQYQPQEQQQELNGETCNNINWENSSMWEIDNLTLAYSSETNAIKDGDGETVLYTYRTDSNCPLGYNPMKQVVCPRFVGWISSYEPDSLVGGRDREPIAHISPYSFFIDVARGARPMVAFAACPRSDEFDNSDEYDSDSSEEVNNDKDTKSNNQRSGDGTHRKDAQRDAEQTGVFCVNLVSRELAWAMNASAAPLGKGLSEFHLMRESTVGISAATGGDESLPKVRPTHKPAPNVNAPFVPESPMFMECRYTKTVKVPDIFEGDSMYSLILGEVVNIHVKKEVLQMDGNSIDVGKVFPLARLGYGQEYTVISECL
ncbi:predicted protein [Thalassiosira pseudonana CCMP1335]|uniref:Flavin reductase like domain-containing protein n=1 Tax=Thalassiosira pseudonana TaxID=35128 RepID=B5YLH1_THAPS|nr:predicted protein [Thalassiosira pseudonana CCMP1335]ACI64229.1 predicted protein [Thalassiosira pseudonana CCMP1335]